MLFRSDCHERLFTTLSHGYVTVLNKTCKHLYFVKLMELPFNKGNLVLMQHAISKVTTVIKINAKLTTLASECSLVEVLSSTNTKRILTTTRFNHGLVYMFSN